MARKVFYSFHYQADGWRASKVRNIGVVEGNAPATDNKWEEVKRGGDAGIKRWIDEQLAGRTCTIVLVGAETAARQWVKYEIVGLLRLLPNGSVEIAGFFPIVLDHPVFANNVGAKVDHIAVVKTEEDAFGHGHRLAIAVSIHDERFLLMWS